MNDTRLVRGFHAMLELYHAIELLSEVPVTKKTPKNFKQVLRTVLRDIAQSILVCFFVSGTG